MVFLYFSTFQNQELPMRWSILLRVLGFLYFENADNTLCWLFGRIHKAKCKHDKFKRGCNTTQISTHYVTIVTTATTHSTLSNTTSTKLFFTRNADITVNQNLHSLSFTSKFTATAISSDHYWFHYCHFYTASQHQQQQRACDILIQPIFSTTTPHY